LTAASVKPDPGDIDGYWVEPDEGIYDRIDPYWIDFELFLVPHVKKLKWRMWADHGDGRPRGVIQVKAMRL
jgi:hypothetical protein